jgi:S1-C subfamily serine protease
VAVAPPRAARALRRSVGLPERDGVLVREVADGEAADRAGLRVGDLIVTANGGAVTSVDDLYDAIDALTDGAALAVEVVRGTDELAVSVTFGPARDEGSA